MKTYSDRLATPLKFHSFIRYFSLPLSLIVSFSTCMQLFTSQSIGYLQFLKWIDIFYQMALFSLSLACIIGFRTWAPYSWKCMIASLLTTIVYSLYTLLISLYLHYLYTNIYALNSPFDPASSIGSFIGTFLYCVLVIIYYLKRKTLFFSSSSNNVNLSQCNAPSNSVVQSVTQDISLSIPSPQTNSEPTIKKRNVHIGKGSGKSDVDNRIYKVMLISITIIALLSLAFNCWQIRKQSSNMDQIYNLSNELEEKKDDIFWLNKKIKKAESSINELDSEVLHYEKIFSQLGNDNIGYASANFNANKNIIVLSQTDHNVKFTLTANWINGGTVYVNYSPNLTAQVKFDTPNWYGSTSVSVIPLSIGPTVITFSNSVDHNTFSILVLVTE